jgi:GTP-binding protein HflX
MLKKIEFEKAIVVGVNINNRDDFEDSMEELCNLAEACHIKVVGKVEQNLRKPQPQYYVGTGKVDEIKIAIEYFDADLVVFGHELTPSQLRNLERELAIRVVDRTNLILEIFERRAKTREAKLQVEAAHLQYLLPRLIGSYENLGRQSGGVGTKNKGVGEKKLELDRRKVEQKIHELNREIEMISVERATQRKRRALSELPGVALVGYTNAGKSTLLNAMLENYNRSENKRVFEKDMLFATLETSVRQIKLPDKKMFTLSDTVGFVSELPHELVKAFRATLEEVKNADLLLHVIDYSNDNYEKHIDVTLETLKEIGADHIPMIFVYNKIDRAKSKKPIDRQNSVMISAKEKIGLEYLVDKMKTHLFSDYIDCMLEIPYDDGKLLSYLNEHTAIKDTEYLEFSTRLNIECSPSDYKKFENFIVK